MIGQKFVAWDQWYLPYPGGKVRQPKLLRMMKWYKMVKPCCFTLNESDGNRYVSQIPYDTAAKSSAGSQKPCHCSNQHGGIFKFLAQFGSCWDGLRLSFLKFKKNISWRRPHWKQAGPCFWHGERFQNFRKTYCSEDNFWNLLPMPNGHLIKTPVEIIINVLNRSEQMAQHFNPGLTSADGLGVLSRAYLHQHCYYLDIAPWIKNLLKIDLSIFDVVQSLQTARWNLQQTCMIQVSGQVSNRWSMCQ